MSEVLKKAPSPPLHKVPNDPHVIRKKCARVHSVISMQGELVRLQKIRETRFFEGIFTSSDANIGKLILTHVQEFSQTEPNSRPVQLNYYPSVIFAFEQVAKLEVKCKNLTKEGFQEDKAPIKKFKLDPPKPLQNQQQPQQK